MRFGSGTPYFPFCVLTQYYSLQTSNIYALMFTILGHLSGIFEVITHLLFLYNIKEEYYNITCHISKRRIFYYVIYQKERKKIFYYVQAQKNGLVHIS